MSHPKALHKVVDKLEEVYLLGFGDEARVTGTVVVGHRQEGFQEKSMLQSAYFDFTLRSSFNFFSI